MAEWFAFVSWSGAVLGAGDAVAFTLFDGTGSRTCRRSTCELPSIRHQRCVLLFLNVFITYALLLMAK